ncbi:ankyrin repeat domain-containing protein 49 isoform X1 [Marmota marmota marmota]|uniref:ankyrin repeat domain-containing protein 49 isoform X1 n=1 Tax=Marmota marmota marmota TaxID=9994 RepID=UPI0020930B8A|nr:ankyrin repeat domain-containing protein 49 isoform X1 [Marmota marmota marmota]XP_048651943.1 ankyrin repeat domain-containing protein 49 isoform X1 [Marmota marmota marmota]XP_048651944.1 ankyrin repeat domain-containing protein 49 isoform X1 [Marmota marmota marmota]XP_048651945.1 ankyrin repeat domain-containing protein 49 isoform X1 [Marmota marmota marmota]XP_048651946.1 ankyrin repeat domain-containing protein 49 isoform X1 [Marmota marmota marmota]
MEKTKINDEGKPDPENSLDFSEHFNQLELLETHGHLIPTGTQSLWVGNSDEDEEQDEKNEEWYQLQEKKMEKDPSKLLLWAAEKNRVKKKKGKKGNHKILTTVQRLLSEKATQVNTRDEDEYTPLHRAAYSGHLDIVRELVAQGADVHAVTVDGWTPLHSACKWNNTRVASFLLQHDADVNAQTKGLLTPLHLAAGNRDSKETLELLLMNRYIKPDLKNNLEETAFDIARRTSIYHYLFEIVEGCTNSSPQS